MGKQPLYPHIPKSKVGGGAGRGGHGDGGDDGGRGGFQPPFEGEEVDAWEMPEFIRDPKVRQIARNLEALNEKVYSDFTELENIEESLLRVLEARYQRVLPSGGGRMTPGHPMTLLDEAHWALDKAVKSIYSKLGLL